MVVSNTRLVQDTQAFDAATHTGSVRQRWIPSTIQAVIACMRRWMHLQTTTVHQPARRAATVTGRLETIDLRQSLLERSPTMFRRENQGESFDDDVAALRDRVGSGQRDQTEQPADTSDDQTTYSPPRQTWSPITQTSTTEANPAPAQQSAWQPTDSGAASVVAADTSWNGNVQSSGSLHVHGNVSGQVRVDGDLYIADGATVNAEVAAGGVTVAGTLEGTVECSGRFEVLPSGRVSANVAAPRLVVHEGARVIGKLRMTSGGEAAG